MITIEDEIAVEELLREQPEFVADSERFAVYTQLARLLAAEDIVVRWNVRGMDCPASMNYATRVLDVAPIRRDCENMIPGLILHEVGHFLFSENVTVKSAVGHTIDVDRAKSFRDKIKNHHVWNIIEDGFIERRVVVRWPGALKHFRVLYDFFHLANRKETLGGVNVIRMPQHIVPEIIDTLHLNVIGSKWNERFDYPKSTPKSLLGLLEKARLCMGTPDERAELSSQIVKELVALTKSPKERVAAPSTEDNEGFSPLPSEVEQMIKDVKEAGEQKKKAPTQKEIDKVVKEIKQQRAQEFVEQTLGADLMVDKDKDKESGITPSPEPTEETPVSEDPASVDGDMSGFGIGGGQDADVSGQEEPSDEEPETETPEVVEEEKTEDDDYAFLEEFISNNKARMIGENKNYLENIMVDFGDEETGETVRHVPSMAQVLATSKIVDMMSDAAKKATATVSFRRFLAGLSTSTFNETKRLPNQFNKKLNIARGNAQQMYQRFITKANATNIALTKYRTTGSLDPTRAALYQIYDDVFQKKRQAPRQVNHGYVVMVDWSSSMSDSTMELFHRIVELTYFAQLANVEIDIWLYTTESGFNCDDLKVKLQENVGLLQPNVMLLSSKFVNVINTKQHTGDELFYRLYAMFINAVKIKNHRMYSSVLVNGTAPLLNLNFADEVLHKQHGTNIFEALNFAISRANKFTTERKAILLLTDGDDNGFGTVADGKGDYFRAAGIPMDLTMDKRVKQVLYNGSNLIDIAAAAKAAAGLRSSGYGSTPLTNVRTIASLMLADEARAQGIAIVGVTWGSYISAHMEAWTRKNVIRVEIPYKDLLSKNLNVYSPVVNTFITNITEALLSNIKK